MDAPDTHTDRATKRLTIKLHNQLCLSPRRKLRLQATPPDQGSQYADTGK